jgi:RNA polymerase sigma-70 factor (ECF subfamily)
MNISPKQEKQLLNSLRTGQKGAVRSWFKLFAPYLLKITLKRVSSKKDAEEIVQETFINCLRQLPLFQEKSRLRTWMVSILKHEIADYYRKKYAKKAIKTIPLANTLLAKPVKNASQTSLIVSQALSRMSKHRKELLLMKYVDKKKVKEIAYSWSKTVKAIESELFRARKEFRALYEQIENQQAR